LVSNLFAGACIAAAVACVQDFVVAENVVLVGVGQYDGVGAFVLGAANAGPRRPVQPRRRQGQPVGKYIAWPVAAYMSEVA